MGLYQTKKLLHSEGNHQQNEKANYWMENIFANDISDKGMIAKIHKEHIQLNIKKQTTQYKMGRGSE